jgi:adenosylhomocysteine nucleosidase
MPIGEMNRPGIIVGMEAEARIARRSGFAVGTLGSAAKLLAAGVDGLISFGIAGGLARGLGPGSLVLGTALITESGQRYPATGLFPEMGQAIRAPVFGGREIVSRAEDKRVLHDTTGAVAVDLESAEVARLCAAAGVPFAIIRAIGDPAERDLPPAALVGLKPDGEVDLAAVLRSVLLAPGQMPALVRVALDTRLALAALKRVFQP